MSDDRIKELAATIADYEAQAKKYKDAADELKAELRAMLPGPGTINAGNLTVQYKSPNRKFDEAGFRAAHPFNKEPCYYTISVNAKEIPDNMKDMYMVPGSGEGTVIIK